MGLNALSVRRIIKARQEAEVMKKEITLPIYYEVHSGIMNYRTGTWISHDPVDIVTTKHSALEEIKWRRKHPATEDQNALYIVRRYRHGSSIKITKDNRKAVEGIC